MKIGRTCGRYGTKFKGEPPAKGGLGVVGGGDLRTEVVGANSKFYFVLENRHYLMYVERLRGPVSGNPFFC